MPAAWEYVIFVPNPDAQDRNTGITEELANKIYKKCFHGEESSTKLKQRVNFNMELKSFLEAYKELDDYEPGRPEKGKKLNNGGRLIHTEDDQWDD
jgi:hypothetical protein